MMQKKRTTASVSFGPKSAMEMRRLHAGKAKFCNCFFYKGALASAELAAFASLSDSFVRLSRW